MARAYSAAAPGYVLAAVATDVASNTTHGVLGNDEHIRNATVSPKEGATIQ